MDKPEIDFHPQPPPRQLGIEDIVIGDGTEAEPGSQVLCHYVGVDYETGDQFDSSWERGEPIKFGLTGLIKGWQEGIPGMRVGGRRKLVVPPDLAYGVGGRHRLSDRTLIFVIDLLGVE